jgi:hypothetical protein
MLTTSAVRKARIRRGPAPKSGPGCGGPDPLGLLVTIALLAAGVVVSFVTLRPRSAATAGAVAEPAAAGAGRESAAVGEPTLVDERAGELMLADDLAP